MDEDRIEQVLTNLIDNAIRHTPEEGSVTVCIRNKSYLMRKFKYPILEKAFHKKIYHLCLNDFIKLIKREHARKGGTGLGLAIAKNIVEAHKGNIKVNSVVGEGTTFTFYLPL